VVIGFGFTVVSRWTPEVERQDTAKKQNGNGHVVDRAEDEQESVEVR